MQVIKATFLAAALVLPSGAFAAPASVTVSIIHEDPSAGSATLALDYGAPFDASKPTVLVIADGQQFYVRGGAMKELQASTFGDGVNVVGIVTRGTTPAFVNAALGSDGRADWAKAWRVFNAREWIDDIDAVRKALVGTNGKIDLYGRSGGAYLVHQYLAVYGDRVARAFTQSAVNPAINAELGIALDHYWTDLGVQDPKLQGDLRKALALHPEERVGILTALQRQHFFVPANQIEAERAALIQKLAAGDMDAYHQARKDYQVDDVLQMAQTNDIIPQDVRVLELIGPSGAFDRIGDGRIYPLAETQATAIKPLLDLEHAGKIAPMPFDFPAVHRAQTEVFVLAGRYDEAVDYRTSIALASQYPRHELFIVKDNHVFSDFAASGTAKAVIAAMYGGGLNSAALRSALESAKAYRWLED